MELFSSEFLWGLSAIILIDLVLAGDNAIVIGMAARNLPADQQKKAIFWGTIGAIAVRASATLAIVWLLQIPALMLVGGLLLVWIAYKLLAEKKDHANIAVYGNLAAAVRTIIIADGVMGIDNVLGVAGAAQGSVVLIIFGFIISVPIIIWGSALFIKTVDRYPVIIYIGGAVLAWTAGKMITEDPLVHTYFASFPVLK